MKKIISIAKTTMALAGVLTLATQLSAQNTIAPGTILPLELHSKLSSRTSKPGDLLRATVTQDVPLGNGTRLKPGTLVMGQVTAVTPASGTTPGTISIRFDRVQLGSQVTPINTSLRAIASPLEVQMAQTPTSGYDRGSDPPWSQTTAQVGGDVIYREENEVVRGVDAVGVPVTGGVLSRISSSDRNDCRGPSDGNDSPQALGVFSHDACGDYGDEAVIDDHGLKNPAHNAVISSKSGDLTIRKGSALLLRVNPPEMTASK